MGTSTETPQNILQALRDNPRGLTVKRIMKLTGFKECSVRVALRTLIASRNVEEAGRVGRKKVYRPTIGQQT